MRSRGKNRIKATRQAIYYRLHHLRRPDIDTTDMDDIRKSLSKLKKDFKHRLGGKKRGLDSTAEERVVSPASLLRPSPRAEEGGTGTGASQTYSTGPPPHSEPATADDDHLDDPQREEDTGEKGVGRSRSSLDPDVGGGPGSRPSPEIKRASSPLPVTSIAPKQEPESTWTLSLRPLCLIALLDNTNTPAVPGHVQPDPRPDENAGPSAAADKKSSWKSTAFATAKLLLRGVRDSADAFGPLKSVAGGLCFILENCEVWASPHAV